MISRLESMDAEVMFSDVRISVLLQEIMDGLKPLAALLPGVSPCGLQSPCVSVLTCSR